ncbi:uncharacterized protein BT62DRAFT_928686 [Guyanagaster necrorhizus]|uniref:Uncharacterized protein n=1 Tax=Guyanagaster necrorhizus TaxID=856835 RepID=A0A9P7VZQ0_9AGAR|nr:uncharacterized protein BT62DRAFT_928686 [Guyanagaster necrorhizus MCA 3950]KAG7449919.1 hypothetical protein BT62DRAFT_928686 [Guyanagaster necrorhizus MCA 3950]
MQFRLLLSALLTVCAVNVLADRKGCDPAASVGIKSAHNCKSGNGKYYLCKQGSTWTCSAVKNMVGLENGECFK